MVGCMCGTTMQFFSGVWVLKCTQTTFDHIFLFVLTICCAEISSTFKEMTNVIFTFCESAPPCLHVHETSLMHNPIEGVAPTHPYCICMALHIPVLLYITEVYACCLNESTEVHNPRRDYCAILNSWLHVQFGVYNE